MARRLTVRRLAALLGVERVARRVRARLDRDPRGAVLLVGGLALAALLALPVSASSLLDGILHIRSIAGNYTSILAVSDDAAVALERALFDERTALAAPDAADLREARGRFEVQAAAVKAALSRIRHIERLPSELRADVLALRQASGAALAELRRRIPAAPPGASGGAAFSGHVDAADEAALARPRALEAAVEAASLRARSGDARKIDRREQAATVGGALLVASVVVLLAGAVSRLIIGRERLNTARGRALLQTRRLERAMEGMREGVALFDAAGTLILRNNRFAETAGLPPEAVAIGTRFAVIAAALADGEPPMLAEALAGGRGRPEIAAEMRHRGRVLEVFRAAMPGNGEILTLVDVTARVEAEAMSRRTVKLEALGRLTGGVAHDFNNLLQALSANLETLAALDGHAGEGSARERLDATLDLVERGTRLTRHLLSFARARPAEAAAIDTASLLRSLEDLLGRTIGDRIEFQLVLEPGLWPVLADRSGFENAILNLAINARDAMPDGGTMAIVATNLPGGADAVSVCVADSGVGMDADQLRRATEPFFTTKPEGAGTGLGLAMVSGFAQGAGGTFALDSERGRGTRATLTLPRAPVALGAEGSPGRGKPVRGLGETILVVEDDHAVRRAVCSGLQAIGYRVTEAASVDAACRILDDGARPDLVLSDVMLPGSLDPRALVARARAVAPAIPILFNTGDPDAPAARTLPLDERTVLLLKPWRLDELAQLVRTMLEGARAREHVGVG